MDKDFSYYSAITLTVALETWFKVTVHPLPKGTLLMKNKPDWPKRSRMDRQTDGRTDCSIYGALPAGLLLLSYVYMSKITVHSVKICNKK